MATATDTRKIAQAVVYFFFLRPLRGTLLSVAVAYITLTGIKCFCHAP